MGVHSKLETLKSRIKLMGSLLVAFSGGVDSTFLLKVSHNVLGGNVLAVTARLLSYPEREYKSAVKFIEENKIPHTVIEFNELEIEGFAGNPPDRCYLCKREIFKKIKQIALEEGFKFIAEGSNCDDLTDYRPGFGAISELGIASPLADAGLTKNEIRLLSREMGLETWDKPSLSCLSSRIPYGEKITEQKLRMVDKAEQYLIGLGLRQVRVRHHGSVARIETDEEGFAKLMDKETRRAAYSAIRELGFNYAALDLLGYRTGSMNEYI